MGGPPCQGFSNIQEGIKSSAQQLYQTYIDDPRNQLFKYFLDFVEYYSTKTVIIENVKGLATSKNYEQINSASLENTGEGYHVISIILNAENYGDPTKRGKNHFLLALEKTLKTQNYFLLLPSLLMNPVDKKT